VPGPPGTSGESPAWGGSAVPDTPGVSGGATASAEPAPEAWHPPVAALELLELLLLGALPEPPAELLAAFPADLAGQGDLGLLVEDAEGTPVARILAALDGLPRIEPVRAFTHPPLRGARRPPGAVRDELAGLGASGVLAVPVSGPLTHGQVAEALADAAERDAVLLWLVLIGAGRQSASISAFGDSLIAEGLPTAGLWRAVRGLAEDLAASAPSRDFPIR
jgi:hypothetical protein